jgi:hypothetical protein
MMWKKILLITGLSATGVLCVADGRVPSTTQQDLIGAWRLLDIDVKGPAGQEADPFYGSGTRGLLIYDKSGWFSVQFEGSGRPMVQVPSVRPAADRSESVARLKADLLDSYYAYYGTWSFDAATSTVTHRAKGALYSSEDGAIYAQHVEIVGSRMTFSRTQNIDGRVSVQTKRFGRISAD